MPRNSRRKPPFPRPTKTTRKDGPRTVTATRVTDPGHTDQAYYYNIIDYAGDMTDYVNLTRHTTLEVAIKEAERLAFDRKWGGPGTNSVYGGIPPRIVRTVRLMELHRLQVDGPLPQRPCDRARREWRRIEKADIDKIRALEDSGKDVLPELMRSDRRKMKHFEGVMNELEWADVPNKGKPHPPLP
jgi:hypothetical protein